ncbi:hypothetical protein [Microcystis panniformis]|uniref:hypothetical protein n=1 Tax=Microcystis panniformis TaxID=513223 RepID=UPI00253F6EC1|nr:hypothetical protein [Microcystis panniformis]
MDGSCFLRSPGNNPYCHHRALKQAEKGIRERFYLDRPAAGIPFDNGQFALVEEPFHSPLANDPLAFSADAIQWPESWQNKTPVLTPTI